MSGFKVTQVCKNKLIGTFKKLVLCHHNKTKGCFGRAKKENVGVQN